MLEDVKPTLAALCLVLWPVAVTLCLIATLLK